MKEINANFLFQKEVNNNISTCKQKKMLQKDGMLGSRPYVLIGT